MGSSFYLGVFKMFQNPFIFLECCHAHKKRGMKKHFKTLLQIVFKVKVIDTKREMIIMLTGNLDYVN